MDASAFMRLREGLSGELIPTLSLGTEDGLSSGAWPTLTQAGNGKAWNAFQFQVPELWLQCSLLYTMLMELQLLS